MLQRGNVKKLWDYGKEENSEEKIALVYLTIK